MTDSSSYILQAEAGVEPTDASYRIAMLAAVATNQAVWGSRALKENKGA